MGSQAVNQDSRNFHREMQDIISALKKFPSCFMEQDKCTLGTEERGTDNGKSGMRRGQHSVRGAMRRVPRALSKVCAEWHVEFRLAEEAGLESDHGESLTFRKENTEQAWQEKETLEDWTVPATKCLSDAKPLAV